MQQQEMEAASVLKWQPPVFVCIFFFWNFSILKLLSSSTSSSFFWSLKKIFHSTRFVHTFFFLFSVPICQLVRFFFANHLLCWIGDWFLNLYFAHGFSFFFIPPTCNWFGMCDFSFLLRKIETKATIANLLL